MQDKPFESMSAANVEEFDVWIFEADDLVISVIPVHAPSNVKLETYEISKQ